MAVKEYIKQIEVGSDQWEIAAKAIQAGTLTKTWEDITALVEAGFDLVVLNNLPVPTSSTTWDDIYAEYHNDLVLVPQETPGEDNHYDEYVIQKASLADATSYSLPSQYSMPVIFTGILGEEPYPTSYETIYEDSYSNSVSVKMDNTNAKVFIKHTVSGSSIYYIFSLQSRSGNWYSDEAGTTLYTGILEFNYHKPNIYEDFTRLFAFVSGSNDAYAWEKIGSTDVDLSNYVQKGTYTTATPSTNVTGEGGATTITTSSAASYTASGTATITYDKVTSITDHTIAAHSHTVNKATASITFVTGLKSSSATAEVVTGVGANGTVTAVTGISVNGTTDVIDSITANTLTVATEGIKSVGLSAATTSSTGAITYVEGITGSAPSLDGDTTFNTDAIKSAELTGTKTFNTDAIKSATLTSGTTATTGYIKYLEDLGNASLSNNTGLVKTVTGQTGTVISTVTNSTGTVMSNATVESNVLKFNAITAVTAVNASTITGLTGVTTGTTDVTITNGTKTTKYATISTAAASTGTVGITTTAATKKTVSITGGSYSATTKYVKPTTTAASTTSAIKSITSTTTSVVNGITASTATVLTGVKATGTATVILNTGLTTSSATFMTDATLSSEGAATLSHTINYTTTTATGSAAVPVGAHTHDVTLPNHTHTLGNHTHDITFS